MERRTSMETYEKEKLQHLLHAGEVAGALMLASFAYGYLFVASSFPKDTRQDTWLFSRSPYPTVALTLTYILVATWIGPRLVAGRRPWKGLRSLIVVYNAFQVVLSAWLVFELGMGGWFGSYSLRCQPCDFSDNPTAVRMLHACYWYYFSKFIDLLETIFFVINRKYDNISILHVTHHAIMPISMWFGLRYQPGGQTTLMAFLNSNIHVVMYTYYFMASVGPKLRPYLWWKKYVTLLQMVQFTACIIHGLQLPLNFTSCPDVPAPLNLWIILSCLLLLGLFADFYRTSYTKKRDKSQRLEADDSL